MKAVLAEFITMALFVYIACGTACSNGAGDSASRLMVAFGFGMSILVLAYSVAHHSGGHINCAVTFALVLSGITPWRQGLIYTVSQMLGSLLGATLLMLTYDCDRDMTGGLGSNVVADGFSYWQVFLAEALMTFMLVYVIFENAVTSKSSSGQNACLVIGFAVFIAHTILLPIDGCSINPTRSFGPAIISALRPCGASENLGLRDLWVMWVGPLFGAAVAALAKDAERKLELVQVNSGNGGAFPCHFDLPSAAAKGARRVLTALLYLNSDWREGDGGEVEILPFPFPDVPVAPCDRRLVLFSSCTTLHRVRPYTGACGRVCINLWFEGEVSVPFPAPLPPCERYDAQACKIVRILRQQPAELRAFCKVWYANTMAESLRDAFEPSEELDAALALHFEEMRAVESRIAPTTLEVLRECLPFKETPLVLLESETADLSGLFDGM
ncbi:unnamed protein product [Polarella glacialis]|uniref:Fe2OG dioxygenase domain-containing protein n=1 Tax=Polarella glacialis TaxID=89957 RepID=A0A813KRJ3_POLGL|nr:unnamed protein product [Polarella glacialis]